MGSEHVQVAGSFGVFGGTSPLVVLTGPFSRRGDSLNDCRIVFVDEVFKIERPGEGNPMVENPMRSEF